MPRNQTVFDDFNLKSLFSPVSTSDEFFSRGDDDDDDDDDREDDDDDDDDEVFLTVRDPDVGGNLIRCKSRDDAVVE